ncbi:response regulator transcription factor [Streptomyces sp. NPDC048424]|uniref:response regulator transcription factor n=1 Tax=Streptomyces sp. NPDC048424 TaxID=3155265 RepID=UPI003414EFB5
MDVRMPGMDGIAATRRLRELPSPPAVLVLTTFGEDEYVEQAIAAGAVGFLVKDTPPADLLGALRSIAAGHAVFGSTVTGHVIDLATRDQSPPVAEDDPRVASLTGRQTDVLRLLGRGLSNADIGAELGMTENTVKAHVTRLLARLGVSNRVEAARIAFRSGLSTDE